MPGFLLSLVGATLPLLLWEAAFERELQRSVLELGDPEDTASLHAFAKLRAAESHAIPALIGSFERAEELDDREEFGAPRSKAGFELRSAIVRHLQQLDRERVVAGLVRALEHGSVHVRHQSANTLVTLGADGVGAVTEAFTSSADPQVRATCAWVLALIGPAARSSLPRLEAACDDEHADVRHMARFAIELLRPGVGPGHEGSRADERGAGAEPGD